jgi:hypothetical protein
MGARGFFQTWDKKQRFTGKCVLTCDTARGKYVILVFHQLDRVNFFVGVPNSYKNEKWKKAERNTHWKAKIIKYMPFAVERNQSLPTVGKRVGPC